ncbi:hypothetical protein Tco_0031941 [Tanacetum coccineum]
MSKSITSLTKGTLRSPLAQRLLIWYTASCRALSARMKLGDNQLIGPETSMRTTEMIFQIKGSYSRCPEIVRRVMCRKTKNPMSFKYGDKSLLKVSPREGVDSRTDKTSDGPEVKAKDEIITSTWNLVDRSFTSAEFSSSSDIVPFTVDTKLVDKVPRHNHCDKKIVRIPLGDETLMILSNRSDGYALIVASEQRVELFDRIEILERDNIRLRGMLDLERQRVVRLWRSMSYDQRIYNNQFLTLGSSDIVRQKEGWII